MILGCYDPIFVIKGEIKGTVKNKGYEGKGESVQKISDAAVSIKCYGGYQSPALKNLKVFSDINGVYEIQGIGSAENCELIFEHPNFKQKTIKIESMRHKDSTQSLEHSYKINVELEPKNGKGDSSIK